MKTMKSTDHPKQLTFGDAPPLSGLGVPEKKCSTCGSVIRPSLLSCGVCAERESGIAIQLQKDEAVRRAVENLKRGGFVYPVVASEKWKSEDGKVEFRTVKHLRSRPSIAWTLCGASPKTRTQSDSLAMKEILGRQNDICPGCFAVATGGSSVR